MNFIVNLIIEIGYYLVLAMSNILNQKNRLWKQYHILHNNLDQGKREILDEVIAKGLWSNITDSVFNTLNSGVQGMLFILN